MFRKKSKKLFKPLPSVVPTNIAVGPLGFSAALDTDPKRNRSDHESSRNQPDPTPDEDNPKPSRIVFCETESGAQERLVPGTSFALTPYDIVQGERPTSECY